MARRSSSPGFVPDELASPDLPGLVVAELATTGRVVISAKRGFAARPQQGRRLTSSTPFSKASGSSASSHTFPTGAEARGACENAAASAEAKSDFSRPLVQIVPERPKDPRGSQRGSRVEGGLEGLDGTSTGPAAVWRRSQPQVGTSNRRKAICIPHQMGSVPGEV